MRAPAWLGVVALCAAFQVHAARPDGSASVTLNQLMAGFRAVRHVEARYVEHRTLHSLRIPLETRGTLRFDAPDRLEKTTDPSASGTMERLTITGDQLTIDRGRGAAPLVVMLNEHPDIAVLVESVRAILAGDGDAMRRIFDIAIAGSISGWQLVLQPHDAAQRGILQWMRITGYADRLTAIDTQAGDGDHSEMTILEPVR